MWIKKKVLWYNNFGIYWKQWIKFPSRCKIQIAQLDAKVIYNTWSNVTSNRIVKGNFTVQNKEDSQYQYTHIAKIFFYSVLWILHCFVNNVNKHSLSCECFVYLISCYLSLVSSLGSTWCSIYICKHAVCVTVVTVVHWFGYLLLLCNKDMEAKFNTDQFNNSFLLLTTLPRAFWSNLHIPYYFAIISIFKIKCTTVQIYIYT